MHIINEPQLDFSDVLIAPKRSELASRKDVDLERKIVGRWNPEFVMTEPIPIMLSNMDNITTWEMTYKFLSDGCMVAMNKFVTIEEWEDQINNKHSLVNPCLQNYNGNLAYTIGIRKDEQGKYIELDQYRKLKTKYPDHFMHLVIDVPNGYSEAFANFVEMVRKEFPDIFIVAGNVVTGDMVHELILKGADCVKVGIGSGNACLTRIKSGVGRPQLSAIIECADAAHGLGGYIISDGGCRTAGDVCKAFCAGADIVMLGSMFAGHDECEGKIVTKYELTHFDRSPQHGYNYIPLLSGLVELDCEVKYERTNYHQPVTYSYDPVYVEKNFKEFWGMSSKKAMEKHYGKQDTYKATEGREILAPYRGPVQNTLNDLLGGLRSMCTYIGARNIKNVPKCATFYLVNQQVSNMFND